MLWLFIDLGKVDIKIVKNTQEASDWTGDLQNSDQRKNKRAFSYLFNIFNCSYEEMWKTNQKFYVRQQMLK